MFKKLFSHFKKKPEAVYETDKSIELSKIDKHMNFILRDKLGFLNRAINDKVIEINGRKEEILHQLRELHKKSLMNPNIPEREIQIMDGNRENFVKRISHFVTNIEMPKNYLETYDYCIKFSQDTETLFKDVQKNIFILNQFFENEIKAINKEMHKLDESIIEIRVMFEKNNIDILKDIQERIKGITKSLMRIEELEAEISEQDAAIKVHKDKISKLNERIDTITSGTDYRALKGFQEEKEKIEGEIKELMKELEHSFSEIETGLKKYFYKNQDRKMLRNYFDNLHQALMNDHELEFSQILKELREEVQNDKIDLKEKKKETTLHHIDKLNFEHLKNLQAELHKLEEMKSQVQTKITHNNAKLNLSEHQYWMDATNEKIKQHEAEKDKLKENINKLRAQNDNSKSMIQDDLEKLLGEKIMIKDDLKEQLDTDVEKVESE